MREQASTLARHLASAFYYAIADEPWVPADAALHNHLMDVALDCALRITIIDATNKAIWERRASYWYAENVKWWREHLPTLEDRERQAQAEETGLHQSIANAVQSNFQATLSRYRSLWRILQSDARTRGGTVYGAL